MSKARIIGASMLALGVLLLCTLPLGAQDNNTYVQQAVRTGVSLPMSELAKLPQIPQYGLHYAPPYRRIPKPNSPHINDAAEQQSGGGSAEFSLVGHILGVGNGYPNYSVPDAPPDTNMAVGKNQIVQWVNVSYIICEKASLFSGSPSCNNNGNPGLNPAIPGNLIWSSLGGKCAANNDGDIIAQYDRKNDRFVLAQNVFSGNFGVCLAISQTNNPYGAYYLYEFPVLNNGFPDYPKWGIWTNNYGQTWNNFGPGGNGFVGPVFCAYNSAKLIMGDPSAEQVCHQYMITEDSLLPADIDSPTLPPAGQDQFAIGSVADVSNTQLSLYSVHVTTGPFSASFTGDGNSQLVTVNPYNGSCSGSYGGACVPQKGVIDKVDSLGDRLMYRFAYWHDAIGPNVPPCVFCGSNGPQHWFVNGDVESNSGQIGVRWYEFEDPTGKAISAAQLAMNTPVHDSTYAGNPPDTQYRWMGSIARDNVGDILLGYSESSSSTYPSIAVAGRLQSDPDDQLSAELLYVSGTGSQPDTGNRWGDYSAMRIDPADNCTFWYTTEYYMVTQQFDWSTDIGAFKFANCK